jgi:hypothetical protein
LILSGVLLSACAGPESLPPPAEAPPAARHPILPLKDGGGGLLGNGAATPSASGDMETVQGPNTRTSRTPSMGARINRDVPKPLGPVETKTYPTPKVPGRGFNTAPVGTIDTRPGTIRPPYLEIPGR